MKRIGSFLLAALLSSSALAEGPANKGPIFTNPTVTASAYTANFAIGGLQIVPIFRLPGQPSAILNAIGVASKGGVTASEAIYAFTRKPSSTCTDFAAFALNSADLPYLVPGFPVTITPASTAGTTQTIGAATGLNLTISNADVAVTTNVYFCAVTLGTPTPASTTDLIFTYSGLQD
jgi:hypothetical protein